MFDASEAVVIDLPVIIKAVPSSGRRLVEVEASNEQVDSEGDVILQQALLEAGPSFVKSGVLDRDHYSEIGYRIGIPNPSEWIVGVPLEVKDIGKGRTGVVGELHQPEPGRISKADELWDELTRKPPVPWRASIYGFPTAEGGFFDARKARCDEAPGARRYVVKALRWKSLAFTRNPINTAIEGHAHVVTMKAHIEYLQQIGMVKGPAVAAGTLMGAYEPLLLPRNRMELKAHYSHHMDEGKCPYAGLDAPLGRSVAAFRDHFQNCCGCDHGQADLLALALMQALKHSA